MKVLNDKHICNNDIIYNRILKIYMVLLVLVLLIPSSSAANINTSNNTHEDSDEHTVHSDVHKTL